MHRLGSWLGKRITVERLAVAISLVVAFVLWSCMRPRLDAMIRVPMASVVPGIDGHIRYLFSPDGSMLAAHGAPTEYGGRNYLLRVFDTSTGEVLYHSEDAIQQVEWSPEHKLFLLRSEPSAEKQGAVYKVMVVDPRTGDATPCFSSPQLTWAKFLAAPDGKTVAVCGGSETFGGFWLIDVPSEKEITSIPLGPHDKVDLLGFSPDSRFFLLPLLLPNDGQLRLYDLRQSKVTWQTRSFSALNDRHAFSSDGRILAHCQMNDMEVGLWDTQAGQALGTLPVLQPILNQGVNENDKFIDSISFAQGNSLLFVVTAIDAPLRRAGLAPLAEHRPPLPNSANVNLFEVSTGRLVHRRKYACNPKLDATGRLLAMEARIEKDEAVRVRDLQHNTDHVWTITDMRYHTDDCFGYVPWRSGQEAVIVSGRHGREDWDGWRPGEVVFLDPLTGKELERWQFPYRAYRVILSPDGKRLLVGRYAQGHEVYELFSFPPRRPWLHIIGWALAAGMGMELIGLGWRRLRRTKSPVAA